MAFILLIETSEKTCSVALSNKTQIVGSREITDDRSHASMLTILIDELLATCNVTMSAIEAVAVSKGPGSYTGLRIGVSVAKGICFALNIPLIAVDTLQSIATAYCKQAFKQMAADAETKICALTDARRMEVYCAMYTCNGSVINDTSAMVLDSSSFENELNNAPVHFIGSGTAKLLPLVSNNNAHIVTGFLPHAKHLADIAYMHWLSKAFEDVAYFEPFYLKDFVATVSKKNSFLL